MKQLTCRKTIFCDITKAFDRVYHPGLLHKLQKSGINGTLLQWFGDYLEGRKQKVVVQGGSSQWDESEQAFLRDLSLDHLYF